MKIVKNTATTVRDSQSTISRLIKRNQRRGSISSKSRARTNADSAGNNYPGPRFSTKSTKKERNILPEPVEIDNYLEEDFITKERKNDYFKFIKSPKMAFLSYLGFILASSNHF